MTVEETYSLCLCPSSTTAARLYLTHAEDRLRNKRSAVTSFAFIFGLFPLWNALGAGGESRRLIGTVTITGMLFSTGIAIFLIPPLFVVVERLANGARNEAPKEVPSSEAEARQPRVVELPRRGGSL